MAFANTDPWSVVPFFGCRAWSYNHRMKRIHSTIGSKFRINCLLFRVLKVHGLCLLYSKGNPFLPSNTKQIQIKTITANPWYKKLNLTVHINVILSEFLESSINPAMHFLFYVLLACIMYLIESGCFSQSPAFFSWAGL